MLPGCLVYAGMVAISVGALSILRPLRFLKIHSRRAGALVVAAGLLLAVVGWSLPANEVRITEPRTQLDRFAPVYEFNEFHSIRIKGNRDQVYRAIKAVTADEILLFRTLVWIRRFGRPGPESILNVPEKQPILEVATRTTFLSLSDEPGREIVVGTVVAAPRSWRPTGNPTAVGFQALRDPGFALATMNFRIEEAGPGACLVTTETRVHATDDAVRRRFKIYWRLIYPGSALIRQMWLRAIRLRVEN